MANPSLVTAATAEPVTLDEFREHARIDFDEGSGDTLQKLKAAREWVEDTMGRQLMQATYDYFLDEFPAGDTIIMPKAPLSSVTTLKYYDANNAQQTWSSSNYQVDTASEPGRIRLGFGVSWPATYDRVNAVEIRFVAGTTAANVPENIKAAIKVLAGQLYEYREETVTGTTVTRIEHQMNRLLWKDRIVEFA